MVKKKMWFTMKHHGWGWIPITWEGWAVTLGFIWYIISISLGVEKNTIPENEWVTKFAIGLIIFIYIMYKTGPKPRWRWDKK